MKSLDQRISMINIIAAPSIWVNKLMGIISKILRLLIIEYVRVKFNASFKKLLV